MRIFTFDTTLRDGTQGEAVSFSVEDKLIIAQKLDDIGIDYIEGGWPGSNPKDKEFFARAKSELKLKNAKLCAFGSTHFARNTVETDTNTQELANAGTPAISIFGKTWDFHVTRALGITLEENLKIINNTVGYLKAQGKELVYDAEHFFDGYINNQDYALRTLEAAKLAGADVICLCDTNGGTLPHRLREIVADIRKRFGGVIGIHSHNDSDVAVANALAAVEEGATHVQGCVNGYGERCGNANIISIIANLEIKMGHQTIGPDGLRQLTALSKFIAERANLPVLRGQPYVGKSAFAHKGGVHVAAIMKDPATYEHTQPEKIGNKQRVLVSDLSGKANITYELKRRGLDKKLSEESTRQLLARIKDLEHAGYELESAEGNFELLILEALHPKQEFFELIGFNVSTMKSGESDSRTTAMVHLRTKDGEHTEVSLGHGPFDALAQCLRTSLGHAYPVINEVRLVDYKVRVLNTADVSTAAKVRVHVEWTDGKENWSTVGVSDNIIEASWDALVTAIKLELMWASEKFAEDNAWAV